MSGTQVKRSKKFDIELVNEPQEEGDKPPLCFLNGRALPKLRTNGTRFIYANQSYIVKVEYPFMEPSEQNSSEVSRLYSVEPKDKIYFPKLVACDEQFKWIIVIREDINTRGYRVEHRKIVDRLVDKYGLMDISPDFQYNWGIVNGKPFIYDAAI